MSHEDHYFVTVVTLKKTDSGAEEVDQVLMVEKLNHRALRALFVNFKLYELSLTFGQGNEAQRATSEDGNMIIWRRVKP